MLWMNRMGGGDEEVRRPEIPLLQTLISWKYFEDDQPRVNEAGIGNKEAVVILHPTKYTVEQDIEDECGSINEDVSPKIHYPDQEMEPEAVLPQLSLAYKEAAPRDD